MRTVEERFWEKVDSSGGPDACWPWTAGRKADGYGQFKLEAGSSPQRASRVAWLLARGDPREMFVLHRCDNPPCCNPGHLFLGDAAANVADMIAKGRRGLNREALVRRVRKLTDEQIEDTRHRHALGESSRSIARRFGVYNTTIDDLISGETWAGYLDEPGA